MENTTKVGEVEWRRRIEAGRRSGRTLSEIAEDHDVALTTVRYWNQRLSRTPTGVASGKDWAQTESRVPRFAKVISKAPLERATPAPTEGGLVIEIGGLRLHLTRADDVPLAAALLETLRRDGAS